jgi:hypothetical protein
VKFEGSSIEEGKAFASRWLPAWTGNDPELLASFYTDDAFYSDPAIPEGVRGRDQLLAYFTKLLERNPEWVWTNTGVVPMENGFLNKWRAEIPVGDSMVVAVGVCTVALRDGRIDRNEVYFDRSELLARLARTKR